MWYLIKSLFRYTFKNKLSTFLLTILLTISVFLLLALGNLSSNLQRSYNKLVLNGNLANIVINENYSSTYNKDPNISDEEAKLRNEEEFKAWLKSQNVEFRDFLSLDYTNTANKKIIKVIEYNNNYDINKLVVYNGNKLYDDTFDFDMIIKDAMIIGENSQLKNVNARRELIYLASKAYWTDSEFQDLYNKKAINLLEKYNDPKIEKYDPIKWGGNENENDIKTYLERWLTPNSGKLISRGYRLNFEINKNTLKPRVVGNLINYSSQFAVVPSYVLKNQNKSFIPNEWYNKIRNYLQRENYINQEAYENKILNKIPEKYKVYVDSLPYIVVGEGISPDFMYPVYSFERITPNINEEVLLYTTSGGYNYALNANRSNPIDSYIVAKYYGNIDEMVKKINQIIPTWMTTAGKNWAFTADDTNNTFQPCGVRLQFLPKLVNMQIAISNLLSIFVLVLAITIFIIMLKKFISDNQTVLAILRSNGYKKRTIMWSTCLFSIIPCLVGGIIGYIASFFTQGLTLNLYSFYWVIPTALTGFNLLTLLLSIIIPFFIFSIVSVVSSYFIIRKAPGSLMNESSKFSVSRLSKIFTKSLPSKNILTKFRFSIALSSISRLLVLIIMISLSTTSIMFAFSTNNKFESAKTITYVDKKYKLAFDLETPTIQGGQYFRTTFENAGKMIFDENKNLLNYNVSAIDSNYSHLRSIDKSVNKIKDPSKFYSIFSNKNVNQIGLYPNNHFPSISDATWQSDDLNFLKNKIESQLFVDVSLGIGGGTNAWDIARNLAPENVQNYSNKLVSNIMQKAINDRNIYFTDNIINNYFSSWKKGENFWSKPIADKIKNKTIKEILINEKIIKEINKNDAADNKVSFFDEKTNQYYSLKNTGLTTVNDAFLAIFGYIFGGIVYFNDETLGNDYVNNFYKLLYNYVPLNENDETYTYINSKTLINGNEYDINIYGIKPNSNFIDLKNINGENLKNLLYISNKEKEPLQNNKIHSVYNEINLDEVQNIIINESAKYQYNIDIGDIIEIDPQNEATRYNPNKMFGEKINDKKTKFKIAGIYRSSQQPEFYINQRVANKLLNMDSKAFLKKCYYDPNITYDDIGYQIDPYNGFFTNDENHRIVSNNLVLYTISGLGPANDKFYASNELKQAITSAINSNNKSDYYLQLAKKDLAYALGFIDKNWNVDINKFNQYIQTIPEKERADKIVEHIVNIWGADPYFSLIHNVNSKSMYMQLFDNTSFLTNSLLIIMISIITIISILSMITIAFDLLNSSLAVASILKALGYSDVKNIITFTSIFIPSLLISIIVSIPLTIILLNMFRSFIYSFSNILLSLPLFWWIPIASLCILGISIIILIIYALFIFRKKSITQSIARY